MRLLTFCLGLVFLLGCQSGGYSPDTTVAIGTFNVEWLGDGIDDTKPRTDADYLAIADVIAHSNVDVLGVQEIENSEALRKLLRYLSGYEGFIADAGGKQNVGVIYRKGLSVRQTGVYTALTLGRSGMRPGLVLDCRKSNFDWTMMVVHLKSTSRYDSTNALREESRKIRLEQTEILRKWSDSVIAASKESDVIIVGDFNDFTGRKQQATLTPLLESSSMTFLTGQLKSCKNPQWFTIDHIVVSKTAKDRFIKGSEYIEDLGASLPKQTVEAISDHCPVVARFRTEGPDND